MADTTISALTAALAAKMAGTAVTVLDDTDTVTKKTTLATLRTVMFAGSTGYTATDPLVCGAISTSGDFAVASTKFTVAAASGNTAVAGTLAVTGASTLTGVVGIGGAVDTTMALYVRSTTLAGATQNGVESGATFSSSATTYGAAFRSDFTTAGGAWTMASGYSLYVGAPSINNTAVTTIYGAYIANQGQAKSTNAYGVYIAAQSGAATTNIGLYNAGTTTLVGAVTLSSYIGITGNANITGAAASFRSVFFQTAGSNRWAIHTTNDAESGANAGSNLSIYAYADGGTYLSNPINIVRSTGAIQLTGNTGIGEAATTTSLLHLKKSSIPTSAAGLAAGDVWSNSGVLTIV